MNSIYSYSIGHLPDKVSEVRSMLNHPNTRNKILTLVEGDDDEDFYGRYLDKGKVFLYRLNGCYYFEKILDNINPKFQNRLAVIKDADFDHLNGIYYTHTNMFLTDKHDYEMMMISQELVTKVAQSYGLTNEEANHIYPLISSGLINYSFIKWHNSRRASGENGISFKKTKAIHHFCKSIPDSVGILQPQQSSDFVINISAIENLKANNPDVDVHQLHNGHDFCELIPMAIKNIKKINIKNKDIPKKLRDLYTLDQFRTTSLASTLESAYPGIIKI